MSEAHAALEQLYQDVQQRTRHLDVVHAGRLRCGRGCSACCIDGLTVFEVEAHYIRQHHAALLNYGRPHAEGACAFLDEEGACRIYAHRPYVCRTQGYPLRWLEEHDDETMVELRDICPLNEVDEAPIEALDPEQCWHIGPFEARLAELQFKAGKGRMRRVALRDLFG